MLRFLIANAIAASCLLIPAGLGWAQGVSNGGFGTSSFGSGGFGSGTIGSSSFGSGNFGALSPGAGTFGSGFGSNGIGGRFNSSGFGSTSMFGSGGTSSPFGDGFGQGGQNFVGRDSSDMQALFQNLGRGSNQFFNQLNRTLDRGSRRNRRGDQGQEANETPPVRVQFRLAPDDRAVPSVTPAQIHARLERVFAGAKFGSPDVTVEGDVVTLRGTAPSENRRLVIEKLAELEPGVRQVWNLMTVAPTADEPTHPE